MTAETLNLPTWIKPRVVINNAEKVVDGIVVLYPTWSIDQRFLKPLIDRLRSDSSKPLIHIFDVDDETCRVFEKTFSVQSHGKCEMYLVKDGLIRFRIERHNPTNPQAEIETLLSKI